MTDSDQPYPWTRRDDETDPAYEAFRTYLNQGHDRSCSSVARSLGKSTQLITGWSAKHGWVERVIAHDRHMETASTDGHAEELARVRSKHLVITDKLLDHLNIRLDHYIATQSDPSVRWIQAMSVALKGQESAVRMREAGKESGLLETVIAKLERLERGQG